VDRCATGFWAVPGLRVSELCLGAMTFGQKRGGWGAAAPESQAIFERFVQSGGNFIDTANMYQLGESESLLSGLLDGRRHEIVLATKYSLGARSNDLNSGGNHRKSMVQALEGSLKRLRTDYIDLYWMHAWDGVTPVDEVLRALDDMVRAGKILYIGFSDTPALGHRTIPGDCGAPRMEQARGNPGSLQSHRAQRRTRDLADGGQLGPRRACMGTAWQRPSQRQIFGVARCIHADR